jgi:hypothetical protein
MADDKAPEVDKVPDYTVDPATIPPADSNEHLKTAEDKRSAAFAASGAGPEARQRAAKARRLAAEAEAADSGDDDKAPEQEARKQVPAGRTTKPATRS